MQDYRQYGYNGHAATTYHNHRFTEHSSMIGVPMEPFLRIKSELQEKRPESVATEFVDLDWAESEHGLADEDDSISEFEETPDESSRNSLDSGSKSMTTVSSYDEATTPRSSHGHDLYPDDPATFYSRPTSGPSSGTSGNNNNMPTITLSEVSRPPAVEGPRGPHLFRLGDNSFLNTDEHVLSLSPITPKIDVAMSEIRHRSFSSFGASDTPAATPARSSIFWPDTEFEGAFASPVELRNVQRCYYTDADLDVAKLNQWTPTMVAQSMFNAGVEVFFADKFIEHDIGGSILSTLKQEDLKEIGITSFGMRSQIWQQVKLLCDQKPASPLPPTPIEDAPAVVTQRAQDLRRQASTSAATRQCAPTRRPSRRHQPGASATVDNIISPMESVSIVGIEQLIPKQHICRKGEACKNYQKSKRLIEQFRAENPGIDMQLSGNVLIAGDPGNAATAPRLDICSPITPSVSSPFTFSRPSSDAVPSIVASSDVLGPGLAPKIQPYLEAEVLSTVAKRDPQDNVKQFLDFQRAHVPVSSEVPPTPPFELFPQKSKQPDSRLHGLPKLTIPGKSPLSSQPQMQPVSRTRRISLGKSGLSQVTNAEESPQSPPRSASVQSSPRSIHSINTSPSAPAPAQFQPYAMNKASPLAQELVSPIGSSRDVPRFGTPFSEMDVPVTHVNMGLITREISQSVPPEMNLNHSYTNAAPVRSQSRASHRRPSFSVLPALDENRATPAAPIAPKTTTPSPTRPARAGSVPPPSTLKAPPRVNYPWSPIERTRPFETAIPPRAPPAKSATMPVPVTSSSSSSTTSSSSTSIGSSSTASTSLASLHSSQTSLSPVFSTQSTSPTSITSLHPPAPLPAGVTYAGPMKKRRTHFLRHEWQEGFFTLKGTRLAMHKDEKSTNKTLEYVDIDDYAVACSSLAFQSKLSAKFKVANIRRGSDKPKDNVAAFSFQLIPGDKNPSTHSSSHTPSSSSSSAAQPTAVSPNGLGSATMSSGTGATSRLKKRLSGIPSVTSGANPPGPKDAVNGTGKTHHFAVKHRKEQMTWMRELMLAKAMKQKGDGFEVSVNGNMI